MQRDDARSVAVVGTRDASAEGINKARKISERLVESGVVVVSGLARGIDTAAHTATLAAGGRTIAVIGTGITRTFPAENKELAGEISESGLIASQFWPSASPAKWTFPRRNVVMSGIAQGTVVVEASSTSGAKMQARSGARTRQARLLAQVTRDRTAVGVHIRGQTWSARSRVDRRHREPFGGPGTYPADHELQTAHARTRLEDPDGRGRLLWLTRDDPSRQGFRGAGAASSAGQVHRWSARRVSPAPFRCRPLAAPSAADHLRRETRAVTLFAALTIEASSRSTRSAPRDRPSRRRFGDSSMTGRTDGASSSAVLSLAGLTHI